MDETPEEAGKKKEQQIKQEGQQEVQQAEEGLKQHFKRIMKE